MPRKKYYACSEFPYHVTARSNNRDWFALPQEEMWEIFGEHLYFAKHAFNLQILNFVLMDNHYHMLLRTPEANLAAAMNFFQSNVSREIGRRAGRINRIFGGPYHWSHIRTYNYYMNAYKYVYRNPVEPRLSHHVETYPYSTLNGLLGFRHLIIPVEEDLTLFSDVKGILRWMNEGFPSTELRDAIGRAFRRTEFKLPKRFKDVHVPQGGERLRRWGAPSEVQGHF